MGGDFNTTQSALQSHSFTRDSRAGTEPATFQSEIDLPTSDFKFICMTCPGWFFFFFLQQKSKKSHPITNSKRVASLCCGLYKNCLHYINKWTISQNVFSFDHLLSNIKQLFCWCLLQCFSRILFHQDVWHLLIRSMRGWVEVKSIFMQAFIWNVFC